MRRWIVMGILGLSLAMSTTSVFALPVGPLGNKMDDLKSQGYTCEYVATNFYECTKAGSTTYWCDGTGACESVRTVDPGHRFVQAPRGTQVFTSQK
jgi:hypothetical protein